jgi:hypothetical protein
MADDLSDDGRRWWFVGSVLDQSIAAYEARSGRSAVAAMRRDVVDAEVANGASQREAVARVQAAQLHVVDGPHTTPEAYERELGWALAWEMCQWSTNVPLTPASVEDAVPQLGAAKVERIRQQVLSLYTKPARPR